MSTVSFADIGLTQAQVRAAARRAKRVGKTPAEYLRLLVERDLLVKRSFDEILRPAREAFERGGKSEDELDEIVNRARRDLYQRSRPKPRRR